MQASESVAKASQRVRTFVTEQKMILFTQIAILIGLTVQIGLFFSLLWWGRPASNDTELVLQFFTTAAIWVVTINFSTIMFWWVSRLGPIKVDAVDDLKPKKKSTTKKTTRSKKTQ